MKNILTLLSVICCSVFCSCGRVDNSDAEIFRENQRFYYKTIDTAFYTFEVEGHIYLVYDGYNCGGIIHAEHCPCRISNNHN